jgi:hypothetical protein
MEICIGILKLEMVLEIGNWYGNWCYLAELWELVIS